MEVGHDHGSALRTPEGREDRTGVGSVTRAPLRRPDPATPAPWTGAGTHRPFRARHPPARAGDASDGPALETRADEDGSPVRALGFRLPPSAPTIGADGHGERDPGDRAAGAAA